MPTTISEEIIRINTAKSIINDKLVDFGLSEATDNITAMAADINGIVNRGIPSVEVTEGSSYSILPGYYKGGTVSGVSGGGNYSLQDKTVTPTKSTITVSPDQGKYGLSSVVINPIPSKYQDVSSVNATASDIIANKIIVATDGSIVTGTMPDNGTVTPSALLAGQSYTIPAGRHSGSGVVTTASLASQTGVDSGKTALNADSLRKGYQGWVNGELISGNMAEATVGVSGFTEQDIEDTNISIDLDFDPDSEEDPTYYVQSSGSAIVVAMSGAQFKSGGYITSNSGITGQPLKLPIKTVTGIFTPTALGGTVNAPVSDGKTTLLSSVTINPVPVDTNNEFTSNGTKTPVNGKFFSSVKINVPTGTARSSSDLTVSGNVVNVPAGLYSSNAAKAIPSNGAISGTITGLGVIAGDTTFTIPSGYTTGGTVSLTSDILTQLQSI